jgi:hypothetical protein
MSKVKTWRIDRFGQHKGSDAAWEFDEKQKAAANDILGMMLNDYKDLNSGDSYFDKQKEMAKVSMEADIRQSEESFDLTKTQASDKFNLMREQAQDSFEQTQLEGSQQAETNRMKMSQDSLAGMVQAGKSGFAGGTQQKMQKDIAQQMGMSMKQIGLGLRGQEQDLQNAIQSGRLGAIQTADAAALQHQQAQQDSGMGYVQTSMDLDHQLDTAIDDLRYEMAGVVQSTISSLTNPYQSYSPPSEVGTLIEDIGG